MDLQQAFEQFTKHGVYLKSWSPKTVRTYTQAFSSFQQSLVVDNGDLNPAIDGCRPSINTTCVPTKAQLEAWVIGMKQSGRSNAGINCYIRGINSFLSWLSDEGHAEALKIKLLPNPSKPLRGFSDNEIRSLLSFRPKGFFELRTWTLIVTLLDTGCRIDELLKIQDMKIELDNLCIVVNGKGNKDRQVPISFELRKVLFRYSTIKTKRHVSLGYLFCTRDGARLSYRNSYREIKKLCAKAGVTGEHVHPHAFRHCFAVNYIRRGGDIYRLSRSLGHASISTTQLYLRSMGVEQLKEGHHSPLSRS